MKKHLTLMAFLFISAAVVAPLAAQSDQGEKVRTRYLQLPNYDISAVDLGTLVVEYAAGGAAFGKEQLKDTKSTCMPKGGGLKDVVEVTTYYYEVPMVMPAAFMVAKDGAGEVVYAEQVSAEEEVPTRFGFDNCSYWVAETMKKEWAAGQSDYKAAEVNKAMAEIDARVNGAVAMNVFPSFVREEFKVYTAKGKSFDYAELDRAQEMALAAYEGFAEQGPAAEPMEKLKTAIAVWEKEIATLDTDNKKARINKSVGKGLYENLLNGYLYTYELDKAIRAGIEGRKLYGNFSNDRSNALDARTSQLRTWQLGVNKNQALVSNPVLLGNLGQKAGDGSILMNKASSNELDRLAAEFEAFKITQGKDKYEANEAMHDAAVASGEVNPYERYITETSTQGKILMLNPLIAPELTEFPREICELTDLRQVVITNNKIASVPSQIKQLSQVKKLNLNNNQLTTLPAEIGEMASLETLTLTGNPLTSLPESLQNCTSLKKVTLKGTSLTDAQLKELEGWLPNAKIKY